MKLTLSKGTKDYLPEEQIVRERIKSSLVKVFERFGFSPLETPIIEMRDVLASKYAGGAEILKEMFTLTDQGKRELALRYDLTVPFARVVGMNPNLRLPFKRYEIGKVFRDGPIKLGRYREFTQCDVDTIGSKSMLADAELIALALSAFNELGLDVEIEVNNRKVLSSIMRKAGVPAKLISKSILVVDKLEKVGIDEVRKELGSLDLKESVVDSIFDSMPKSSYFSSKLSIPFEGADEIESLNSYLRSLNVDMKKVKFVPSLARGLEIYTGTIFEVFLKDKSFTSALAAGGRYDDIIGKFIGKGEVPAVGISFGLDAVFDALKLKGIKMNNSVVQAYIIPIKVDCLNILSRLRSEGICTDIDQIGRSPSKNLDFANKEGIPFVVIVGQKEKDKDIVKLKNMVSGEESELSLEKAAEKIKSYLAKSL